MNNEEKLDWITAVWEPAHQLELMTKDCKKKNMFDWFNEHIDVVNDELNDFYCRLENCVDRHALVLIT